MFNNLFSHWVLWLIVTVVVLGFLEGERKRNFKDRASYSIKGEKGSLGFIPEWWDKNYSIIRIAVAVIGLVLMVVGCSSSEPAPPPVAVANCQGSYVGSYGPPEHEERIRLRNLSLDPKRIAATSVAIAVHLLVLLLLLLPAHRASTTSREEDISMIVVPEVRKIPKLMPLPVMLRHSAQSVALMSLSLKAKVPSSNSS